VPLYPNLGSLYRDISAVDERARSYFNQGLRLTYGFGHPEAVRSFREARRQDPGCATCWWGEAWALGPYINSPSLTEEAEREAHAAISAAMELRDGATPVERALIEAMAVRYEAEPDPGRRAALDSTYADAMREVVREFPHDLDAATLFAEALMVLRPWDQWQRDGTPNPGTEEVVAVLESVLGRDLGHPGACHLYIHAVEASSAPERAEPCADLLGESIPGASHIRHMPSHIYMQVGRYGDAVRANQQAWQVDQQAARGGPPGIYPTHNLHMLAFAASFDGQSAVAFQAARDLTRIAPGSAFYEELTLARFGRWVEILEREEAPEADLHRGVWHFARGLAHLRSNETSRSRDALTALEAVRDQVGEARFRFHSQADLLGMTQGILAGEIHAASGDFDEAVEALEAAVRLEDGLTYDEPEPWFIPVRHVLGAVLLEAGRPAQAERVHREQLRVHPENGWSLLGLAQALRAQGRDFEAEEVDARFARAWSRADVWLEGSRW
jgi:tetratricopeptide (TPR) repeat protein